MAWYARLAKENLYGVLNQLSTFIFSLAAGLTFPLVFGLTDYGLFTLVVSIAGLWLFFGDLGLNTAVLRFLPAAQRRADSFVVVFWKTKVALCAMSFLLLVLLSHALAEIYKNVSLATAFFFGAALFAASSIHGFQQALFIAVRNARFAFHLNLLANALKFIFPLVAFVWTHDFGLAVFALALAYLVPVVWGLQAIPCAEKAASLTVREGAGIVHYMLWGSVSYLSVLLLQWAAVPLIGLARSPEDIAWYRVGSISGAAVSLLLPFSGFVLTAAFAGEGAANRRKIFFATLRYGLFTAFLFVTGAAAVGAPFIRLLYGPAYAPAEALFVAFTLLGFEALLTGLASSHLLGVGRIRFYTIVYAGFSLLQVALLFIVTPALGIGGAAAVVIITRVASAVFVTLFSQHLLGLRISLWLLARPFAAFLFAYAASLAFQAAAYTWPGLILLGAATMVAYILFGFALGAADYGEIRRIASAVLSQQVV